MTDEIVKRWGIWGVLLIAGAIVLWWVVQYIIVKGDTPAAIVGTIESPPGPIKVLLDNGSKETTAHKTIGWFRFEEVVPGRHLIEYKYSGFHPRSFPIRVAGGQDNFYSLPSLSPASGPKPTEPPNALEPVVLNTRSRTAEEPDFLANYYPGVARLVGQMLSRNAGWLYLGRFDGTDWTNLTVSLSGRLPRPGDTLEMQRTILLRDDKPHKVFPFSYEVAPVVGVAMDGEALKIQSVHQVGNDSVWAEVSAVTPK
jgi:hypothetical protein